MSDRLHGLYVSRNQMPPPYPWSFYGGSTDHWENEHWEKEDGRESWTYAVRLDET